MRVDEVKVTVGRTEGFVSSLNLQFPNGLVLSTKNLVWLSRAEKENIRNQFSEVCLALKVSEKEMSVIAL